MAGRRWLRQLLRAFGRDQRGNAAVIFCFCAVPLAAGAGLAIDTMLAYSVEDQLQKSLDAAGLAAGRTALPEDVEADARSYFNTNFGAGAGFAELTDFDVDVNEVGDELTLTASAQMQTHFMRLFGHDTVTVAARTVINRQVRGLELALVLDVTGSMVEDNKIGALKTAAAELIDILYGDRETVPDLWVSLVPYTGVVNIGTANKPFLAPSDQVNTAPSNFSPDTWAGCVMARTAPRDQNDDPPSVARFASYLHPKRPRPTWPLYYDNDWGRTGIDPKTKRVDSYDNGVRYYEGYGPNQLCPDPITPLTAKKSTIKSRIAALQPWHRQRGATHTNIGLVWGWRTLSPRWRGLWNGAPSDLPLDYATENMDKAVIVLTDGDNTLLTTTVNGSTASRYTAYPNLAALGATSSNVTTKLNQRTTSVCTAIKTAGITVYAITFGDSPSSTGQSLMRGCASSPALYWHSPDGTNLRTVFRTIGTQLSKLRIAQ